MRAQNFYLNQQEAIVQNLEIEPGVINYDKPLYTLKIHVDTNLQYLIYITDPILNFVTVSPELIPRIHFRWKPKDKEVTLFLMQVYHVTY